MKKETITNIIENLILERLQECYLIKWFDICQQVDEISNNEDDTIEIIEIISNSKKFNNITLKNGNSFIVGKDKNSFSDFLEFTPISENDDVWNQYFYFNNQSMRLIDIKQEIEE